ncbi:sugar ABC transporter permease [Caloramator sp. CAR-1]|uniref:carbohydrate ABC transporter permease n=1 Tax=Caloramator sp. CAR-1 TaxID=3062777 RepID=UPI0026E37172|nr:sugar ABC transporter permease [Caloramator sp. CAR-1]MDO6354043.1 sugar ABC transporter permease [Caloramator sp. CAR-1]
MPPYNWFGDPRLALPTIMMMAIWSSVGLYMVIFLAGLQDIPSSLYEAARIDGASKIQEVLYITVPLLKPTIFFNLVVSLIGTFQVFDQAFVVSNGTGGPLDSTMTVVLYLYNTGFRDFQMGYASAIAFILFAIIFILTLIQRKFFGEETEF